MFVELAEILRQERAGGRLDSQIEDLCRGLEIVGVCPYGTVVIAFSNMILMLSLNLSELSNGRSLSPDEEYRINQRHRSSELILDLT